MVATRSTAGLSLVSELRGGRHRFSPSSHLSLGHWLMVEGGQGGRAVPSTRLEELCMCVCVLEKGGGLTGSCVCV